MKQATEPRKGWKHYHWVIFTALLMQNIIIAGIGNNLYSLYTIPVTTELDIPRSAFSLASAIGSIPAFFSNLIFALLYNRYGFRKLATLGLAIVGLFYTFYACTQTVYTFYVGAVFLGFSGIYYSTAGTARVVPEWFHRHQGLLLGIIFSGSGIGSSLFSIILSHIIERYNWRVGYGVTAVIYFLFAVMYWIVIRNKPAEKGLEPLGDQQEAHAERKKQARNVQEWEGLPLKVLKKRPYFYMTLLGLFLTAFLSYIIYPTLVSRMQDIGMSQSQAAQIQSFMFLFLAGAKILEGALSDRFGARRVMFLCLACGIVSAIFLSFAQSMGAAILGCAIFSMVLSVSTIMLPVLTADVFGRHSYGAILGIMLAVIRLATGSAPTVANGFYDLLGSYTAVYRGAALLGVAALLLFIPAFIWAGKEKKAFLQIKTIEE